MKPLETDRVKKLVKSAIRFSSGELQQAIIELKKMHEAASSEEYIDRLRSFAKSLQVGDPIICDRNYYQKNLPKIGDPGVVEEVKFCRAPKVAWVLVNWGPHIPRRWFTIGSLAKLGSMSKMTIDMNRGIARVLGGMR